MDTNFFQGKTACVTGAGRGSFFLIIITLHERSCCFETLGIGQALALRLAKLGCKVIAISKTEAHLKELVSMDNTIRPVCVDLSDWAATKNAIKEHLPIQLLVNNAAVAILDPFLNIKLEDVDTLFNVNVRSIICLSQEIVRDLIERKLPGSIVNVSSQASAAALKDHTVYCATKASVDAVTRNMALELGPHQIRVNSVQPTVVLTDMGRIGWSDEKKAAGMLSKIPLNKFAEVDDVVEPIIFLLSDKSGMINGVGLPIVIISNHPLMDTAQNLSLDDQSLAATDSDDNALKSLENIQQLYLHFLFKLRSENIVGASGTSTID
ncbi:unnamed protein product, partial [Didymodactylos carnosus]